MTPAPGEERVESKQLQRYRQLIKDAENTPEYWKGAFEIVSEDYRQVLTRLRAVEGERDGARYNAEKWEERSEENRVRAEQAGQRVAAATAYLGGIRDRAQGLEHHGVVEIVDDLLRLLTPPPVAPACPPHTFTRESLKCIHCDYVHVYPPAVVKVKPPVAPSGGQNAT